MLSSLTTAHALSLPKKFARTLGPLLGLVLFAAALWVLYGRLRTYSIHQLFASLKSMPPERLLAALALTVISFVALTGYDALAVRYIRERLPYRKIALTSFLSYAFGHNVGVSALSGGSMRYHLYSSYGFDPMKIARIIAFCSATFWVSYLALSGVVFVFNPIRIPPNLHLPFLSTFLLGLILLLLLLLYAAVASSRKETATICGWKFPPFSPWLFLGQILVGAIDAASVAGVLYVLLPHAQHFTYFDVLGIFLLAQITGIVSQVPGGIGVFETVFLALLPASFSEAAVLGSLLVYRGIYYLLPLIIATNLFAIYEVQKRTNGKGR